MIRAHFYKNDRTGALTLKVTGHSGAANRGEDLVCAAASILMMTAAQDAHDLYTDGRLKEKPYLKLKSGRGKVEMVPTDAAAAEALHTLFIIQKGFLVLAANEPRFVKVRPFIIHSGDTAPETGA